MMNLKLSRPKIKFGNFRLKHAKLADLKSVTRLFSRIDKNIKRETVREMIERKRVFVLKDRKKGVKAAFANTVFTLAGIATIVYISKLSVHPGFEGQGMGTFVLEKIRDRSIKIGAVVFFLYSVKRASDFYKKNKMQNIGRLFWRSTN